MDDPFLSGGGTDEELEAELAAELAALGEITEDEVQAAQQGLLEHPFAWIPEEEPAEVPRSAPQQSGEGPREPILSQGIHVLMCMCVSLVFLICRCS